MSNTPRTDALIDRHQLPIGGLGPDAEPGLIALARDLERELAEVATHRRLLLDEDLKAQTLVAQEKEIADLKLRFSHSTFSWVPVSEREPERSGQYLTWDGEEFEVMRWNDGDFYRLYGEGPPTHWMPVRLEAPK